MDNIENLPRGVCKCGNKIKDKYVELLCYKCKKLHIKNNVMELDLLCQNNSVLLSQRLQKIVLADVLMDLLSDKCNYDDLGYYGSCVSSEESAFYILEQMGYVRKVKVKPLRYEFEFKKASKDIKKLQKYKKLNKPL